MGDLNSTSCVAALVAQLVRALPRTQKVVGSNLSSFYFKDDCLLFVLCCCCFWCLLVLFMYLHLCFSCVFPELSITPENLSTVLESMDDDLWRFFSRYVNIPTSEAMEIGRQFSTDSECKQALIHCLVSTHPALSWRLMANALYKMGYQYGGDSCHRALAYLQQRFPTGLTNYRVCF